MNGSGPGFFVCAALSGVPRGAERRALRVDYLRRATDGLINDDPSWGRTWRADPARIVVKQFSRFKRPVIERYVSRGPWRQMRCTC